MFGSTMPTRAPGSRGAGGVLRARSVIFVSCVLVGLTLTLFMLFAMGALHASQATGGNFVSSPAQATALAVARQRTVAPALVEVAAMSASFAGLGADHCNESCCASQCCGACSVALIDENSALPARDYFARISIRSFDAPLPSAGTDAPFRPPRPLV